MKIHLTFAHNSSAHYSQFRCPILAISFVDGENRMLTVVGFLCIELILCVYFCYLMCIVLLCVCVCVCGAVLHALVAG
jgi:hypothetical protein